MPSTVPTTSVVVPTFNRGARLRSWAPAVLAQEGLSELVIVDDGSTDDTPDVGRDLGRLDSRVRFIRVGNGGQFAALQAGALAASGDVLVCLDDDVEPTAGLVAGHARHHVGAEALVVLGYMPVQLPDERTAGDVASYLYAEAYEFRCAAFERDASLVLESFWAGNFSLRRTDALRVGFADPDGDGVRAFPYHPDKEFGLRAAAAGLSGRFDRTLVGHHLHRRSEAAFLREAEQRAVGAWHLHLRHADRLGPWSAETYTEHVPGPARLLVRAAHRQPAMLPVLLAPAKATMAGAGRLRWWRLQEVAATVAMHQIEVATVARRFQRLDQRPSARSRGVAAVLGLRPIRRWHQRRIDGIDQTLVIDTVERLERAGIGVWLAGGWGVDALVGRQTRAHHDLDLAVDDLDLAVATLEAGGATLLDAYEQPGAGLPHRTILRRPEGAIVDLHPVEGGQAVAMTTGRVGGRSVGCLDAATQLRFHEGYEARRVDSIDVWRLRRLAPQPPKG